MGRPDTGLLVVADFDTPAGRGRAHHRPPAPRQTVYRVVGHPRGPGQRDRGRRGRGRREHRLERPQGRPPAGREGRDQRARGAS
jgi:hypothetical protein